MALEISKEGAGKASPAHSNLFVGNLSEGVTEDDLKSAFGPFGKIESVMLTSKGDRSHGFVKMADVGEAAQAVEALNGNQGWDVKFANYDIGKAPKWNQKGGFGGGYGMWFGGMGGKGAYSGFGGKGNYGGWTYVKGGYGKGGVPELREDGPEKPEPPQSDNLYVKHLTIGVTEESVKEAFAGCGEVAEVRILRPEFALECAALVRFATTEGAAQARTTLDGTVMQGSTPVLYANNQNKGATPKKDHVYVKGIPTNTSEDKIKAIFAQHGEVKWNKIMRSIPGQSRIGATCAALFEMGSEEEAEAAIAALNEKTLSLSDFCGPMRVRYAENKAANKAAAVDAAAQPSEAPEDMPATRLST